MAKSYDKPIDKTIDWGGNEMTEGLPVKGSRVQEFIKDQLEHRIGILYYDATANRYLAFADDINRDEYLADTTRTDLILGTFDAPFNYSASIRLVTEQKVNVMKGSTGNYIEFSFDTFNKEGLSVGESVICTYTFMRGTVKKVVTAKYAYQEHVKMSIDDYLQTGTNTITISIQGQTTFAATTVSVIYGVIDLQLSDSFDISELHDISDGELHQIEIPYEVSGQGTKEMEWYIDSEAVAYNKDEDEILDSSSARVKYLDISELSDGRHTLQFRVYTTVDGEKFYSDTCYRDFFVKAVQYPSAVLIGVSAEIPFSKGIVSADEELKLYNVDQYAPYSIAFAVYNPAMPASTAVEVYVNDNLESTIGTPNGTVETFTFTPYLPGDITLKLKTDSASRTFSGEVSGSSMDISEITSGLVMAFKSSGRSNSATDKAVFNYGDYVGSFDGFLWNTTSGWVDNSLLINNGATFGIDWAPLGNDPSNTGRTLEFSFCTTGVSDDDAVICSLMKNDIGLKITASEIILQSREGKTVSTRFKSEENVRIAIVINRRTGTTNKGLAFIYIDGILSGATKFASSDSFESDVNFSMSGSSDAELKLYQIRAYDTALSSDQVLNNFILYQNTTAEMQDAYYRNDITESGSSALSMDKLEKFLPVMLVTGNIPVLEATKNKKEQITVDIDYYNLQDPTKSFTMKKAAMTPQGTSSMSYPKKNFRIYTKKIDDTKVYDYQGNEIEDKLYAFKDGAQPVKTWCLKADYAESSSTHNTGIARLWNTALYNAQIDGEYKLRTAAQVAALQNGYEYDVRTTVDGFPILMFYRLTEDSDVVFIGKYNFNNDKSTESVFGFKDIPGFDNSRMQCWEVLNNGNHLALFQDVTNFDTEWTDAFEARYPDDGDEADTTDLKAFATWLVGVKDDATKFATEKWNHLDVYKIAAYYIYLMRFGAVDQTVKNAMFTSEDGEHFYYINYDNDTINGVRNDGLLIYPPTIDRQSLDTTYSTEVYAYAGHDSTLWNMLEADSEFMSIVSVVDNALYQSGLKYADVIDMFNVQQSKKWCEKIYNQDSQYKYIGPYVNDGIDNLYMLQGSRAAHRKWWLSRRFNLLDSKYVSGAYKSNVLECKMASAPSGIQFTITSGFDMDYGYGVNNIVVEKGVSLAPGETKIFTTKQVLNIGDPMRIYTANNLQGVDISGFIKYLSTVNVSSVYDEVLGTKLKILILGDGVNENTSLSEIQGLVSAKRLETLNIEGYKAITSLDLSKALYLKELIAGNSGLRSVDLAEGNQYLTKLELSDVMQSLTLKDLPNLSVDNFSCGVTNLINVNVSACPKMSTYAFVKNIIDNASSLESISIDNINWSCTADELLSLVENKSFAYNFYGKVTLDSVDQTIIDRLSAAFGNTCFNKDSAFYIIAPDSIFISGASEVLEGDNEKYTAVVFSSETGTGTTQFKLQSGSRTGVSFSSDGLLTTTENGNSSATLTLLCQYISPSGKVSSTTKSVVVAKRTYPTSAELLAAFNGTDELMTVGETYTYTLDLDKSKYTGRFTSEILWDFTGDLTANASLIYSLNNICKISFDSEVAEVSTGTLTVTVTKQIGGTISASKTISAKNENIAISKASNPYVMLAFYKAGLAANENYMTKTECALVTDSDLNGSSTSTAFFYKYNSYKCHLFTTFDEFRYFTSLTKVPDYFCSYCEKLTNISLPEQITSIATNAFYKCTNLDLASLKIPETVSTLGASCFSSCVCTADKYVLPETITTLGSAPFDSVVFNEFVCNDTVTTSVKSLGVTCSVLHIGDNQEATSSLSQKINTVLEKVVVKNNSNYRTNEAGSYLVSPYLSTRTILVWCKNTTNIPEVTDIAAFCFYYDTQEKLIIPKTVIGIDSAAFWSSSTIEITTYSSIAFPIPTTLKKLNIQARITNEVGNTPFYSDKNFIDTIEIGPEVSSLIYQIPYCNTLICNSSAFTMNDGFLVDSNNVIKCIYKNDTGVYDFSGKSFKTQSYTIRFTLEGFDTITLKNVTPLDTSGSIRTFSLWDFRYCPITTLDLTDACASEGWSWRITAYDNDNIKRIILPTNLSTLQASSGSNSSLYNIPNLEEVVLGEKLQSIEQDAINLLPSLKKLTCLATTAPTCASGVFGSGSGSYVGRNTYSTGENMLYVPADSTGYDSGRWADPLCDSTKCGFTLSKTL